MITGNAMQSIVQIALYMLCSIDAGARASKCWCVLVCNPQIYDKLSNLRALDHVAHDNTCTTRAGVADHYTQHSRSSTQAT